MLNLLILRPWCCDSTMSKRFTSQSASDDANLPHDDENYDVIRDADVIDATCIDHVTGTCAVTSQRSLPPLPTSNHEGYTRLNHVSSTDTVLHVVDLAYDNFTVDDASVTSSHHGSAIDDSGCPKPSSTEIVGDVGSRYLPVTTRAF